MFLSPSGRKLAAVLVPVYPGPEGPTLLLIRRTTTINHPGQVAFPGGRPEAGDHDLLATALREAQEELGIDPAAVTVAGVLPVIETLTSNYAISAFVGRLDRRPDLRPQASEVAAVLDVPLRALMAPDLPRVEEWEFALTSGVPGPVTTTSIPGETVRRPVRYFPWGEDKIWGATARMLELLLVAVRNGSIAL